MLTLLFALSLNFRPRIAAAYDREITIIQSIDRFRANGTSRDAKLGDYQRQLNRTLPDEV